MGRGEVERSGFVYLQQQGPVKLERWLEKGFLHVNASWRVSLGELDFAPADVSSVKIVD